MTVRLDQAVTAGTFTLDGETFDVENNLWVIGDENECLVIDAPHDVEAILELVGERSVVAIACTHAHDDHVRVAPELAERTGAPILLNPDDLVLWDLTHPERRPDGELHDGQHLDVAGTELEVIATPGHAPGAVCFWWPERKILFSGDTLFQGGPGATGRSYSDRGVLENTIRDRLFPLGDDVTVKTGHGPDTTLGAEKEGDWV